MNERLKAARKALGLNQTAFGARIGVTNPAISKLEKGERNFTDQMVLAICREFSINEEWLRNGTGDMFVANDGALITSLVSEYGLNGIDAMILETYIRMPKEQRIAVGNFLCGLAEAVQKGLVETVDEYAEIKRTVKATSSKVDVIPPYLDSDEEIEAEVENYRRQLLEEKEAAGKSSALPELKKA